MRPYNFRAWDGEKMILPETFSSSFGKFKPLVMCDDGNRAYKEYHVMQALGLNDKLGTPIFEDDLLLIKYKIGDEKDGYFTEGVHQVRLSVIYGVSLFFASLHGEKEGNQFPINQELSFRNGKLNTDYVNSLYNHLSVSETHSSNHHSGRTWKENWYSNDIEKIGSIYETPELLKK